MSSRKDRADEKKQRLAKEKEERERKRKRKMTITGVIIIGLIALVGIYFAVADNGSSNGYTPTSSVGVNTSSNQIMIPISELSTTAQFSTYETGGKTVRFFEVKDANGGVHVATDACDVCYANHKGYRQSGTVMECNNCGKIFAIDKIGTENTAGGCWPSYLPIRIDGGNVVINKSDLDGKAFMF